MQILGKIYKGSFLLENTYKKIIKTLTYMLIFNIIVRVKNYRRCKDEKNLSTK